MSNTAIISPVIDTTIAIIRPKPFAQNHRHAGYKTKLMSTAKLNGTNKLRPTYKISGESNNDLQTLKKKWSFSFHQVANSRSCLRSLSNTFKQWKWFQVLRHGYVPSCLIANSLRILIDAGRFTMHGKHLFWAWPEMRSSNRTTSVRSAWPESELYSPWHLTGTSSPKIFIVGFLSTRSRPRVPSAW